MILREKSSKSLSKIRAEHINKLMEKLDEDGNFELMTVIISDMLIYERRNKVDEAKSKFKLLEDKRHKRTYYVDYGEAYKGMING